MFVDLTGHTPYGASKYTGAFILRNMALRMVLEPLFTEIKVEVF